MCIRDSRKAPDAATTALIARQRIGGVVLTGSFKTGIAGVRGIADQVAAARPLLIATSQEGGPQQPLAGPGFATIPAPAAQVARPAGQLRSDWATWGGQLADAGVRLNLAPTGDVLSKKLASTKVAAGTWDRLYGSDPDAAAQAVGASVVGLKAAGVAATATHYPGLGAVGGAGRAGTKAVSDTATTLGGPASAPYREAVAASVPAISVSTITYTKIDPDHAAVYSSAIVDSIRTDLGFGGAIVSDDLAVERLAQVPAGERVLRFIAAGGDLAYVSDPTIADAAVTVLVGAAESDPALAQRLSGAAAAVLGLRAQAGLGTCVVISG